MENLKGLNCEHLTKESQSASDDQVKILKKQIPEWNLVDVNGVKHLER